MKTYAQKKLDGGQFGRSYLSRNQRSQIRFCVQAVWQEWEDVLQAEGLAIINYLQAPGGLRGRPGGVHQPKRVALYLLRKHEERVHGKAPGFGGVGS